MQFFCIIINFTKDVLNLVGYMDSWPRCTNLKLLASPLFAWLYILRLILRTCEVKSALWSLLWLGKSSIVVEEGLTRARLVSLLGSLLGSLLCKGLCVATMFSRCVWLVWSKCAWIDVYFGLDEDELRVIDYCFPETNNWRRFRWASDQRRYKKFIKLEWIFVLFSSHLRQFRWIVHEGLFKLSWIVRCWI